MHSVTQLIHNRLKGLPDNAKLAIISTGGGQRWVTVGGMVARLRLHNIEADIMGGSSGGGLAILYYATGQSPDGVMVLRHLTPKGFTRLGGAKFITKRQVLRGQPVMDLNGLVHDAFTHKVPLAWGAFQTIDKPIFLTATKPCGTIVVQRVNGQPPETCKAMAINTARIPLLAHRADDSTIDLWDGCLSQNIPIETALEMGATHILVLCCDAAPHAPPLTTRVLEKIMLPFTLKRQNPKLYKLWLNRGNNSLKTQEQYRHHPNIQFVRLPKVPLSNASTNEKRLLQGAIQGFKALGEALHLPPSPYPASWLPALSEHKLNP